MRFSMSYEASSASLLIEAGHTVNRHAMVGDFVRKMFQQPGDARPVDSRQAMLRHWLFDCGGRDADDASPALLDHRRNDGLDKPDRRPQLPL